MTSKMKEYSVTLTGTTPLLLHHDSIEWADFMEDWRANPENKKHSKAGDDRTPAWRWIGSCYQDGKHLVIPQANIMRALMEAGALIPIGGKSRQTYKTVTQSGMMCTEPHWALLVNGEQLPWGPLKALQNVSSFADHLTAVRGMGFDLLVKRAKVGTSKHIRVRPQFAAGWQLVGTLTVWDERITQGVLQQLVTYAGQYKGLGDWRPGGKTPGPYGMFEGSVE